MGGATVGLALGVLLAPEISSWLFGTDTRANLVRAASVLLWANLNYQQMTSLFRVEQRSVAYVIASLANVLITIGATDLARRRAARRRGRRARRKLHGDALRVLPAACVPTLPARVPVRSPSAAPDERVRAAARAVGARVVGEQLQRSPVPREALRGERGRPDIRSGFGSRPRSCCC